MTSLLTFPPLCATSSLAKTFLHIADSNYLLKFSRRCLQSSVATSCNVRLHLSFFSASNPPWLQRISRQFCKSKSCIIFLSICYIKLFYQYAVKIPKWNSYTCISKDQLQNFYTCPNDVPHYVENQLYCTVVLKVSNQDFEKAEHIQPSIFSLQTPSADPLKWSVLNIWPLVYIFT